FSDPSPGLPAHGRAVRRLPHGDSARRCDPAVVPFLPTLPEALNGSNGLKPCNRGLRPTCLKPNGMRPMVQDKIVTVCAPRKIEETFHVIRISRSLPLLGLMLCWMPFAHAQSSFDVNIGFGAAQTTSLGSVDINTLLVCSNSVT